MNNRVNASIIELYLKINDLSATAFCKKCGICRSTFKRIMTGKDFYLTALYKISIVIGLPIHYFFRQ